MVTPDTRGRAQHTWSHLTCMVTPDTRGHVRHVRGAADCTHRHSILQRGVIPAHRCRNCSPRLPRSSWEPMSGAANPSRGSEHLVRGRAGAPAPEAFPTPGAPPALLPGLSSQALAHVAPPAPPPHPDGKAVSGPSRNPAGSHQTLWYPGARVSPSK